MPGFSARSQISYNYHRFAIEGDFSFERGYTNIAKQYNHPSLDLTAVYNYSPYIPVGLDIQSGTLSGGGLTPALDKFGRKYTNNYLAFYLRTDFQLGEVVDYSTSKTLNILKDFYFGTGVGMVKNNNQVQRFNLYPWNGSLSYRFPGEDKSFNFSLPLRFGYEFKFFNYYDEPSWAIDLTYAHYIVFGEGLDGYNDPVSKFKNNAINQYRQIIVAIKFNFGNISAFVKPIEKLY